MFKICLYGYSTRFCYGVIHKLNIHKFGVFVPRRPPGFSGLSRNYSRIRISRYRVTIFWVILWPYFQGYLKKLDMTSTLVDLQCLYKSYSSHILSLIDVIASVSLRASLHIFYKTTQIWWPNFNKVWSLSLGWSREKIHRGNHKARRLFGQKPNQTFNRRWIK